MVKIVAKIAGHAVKKRPYKATSMLKLFSKKNTGKLIVKAIVNPINCLFVNPKNNFDFMVFSSLGIDTTKLLFILI